MRVDRAESDGQIANHGLDGMDRIGRTVNGFRKSHGRGRGSVHGACEMAHRGLESVFFNDASVRGNQMTTAWNRGVIANVRQVVEHVGRRTKCPLSARKRSLQTEELNGQDVELNGQLVEGNAAMRIATESVRTSGSSV